MVWKAGIWLGDGELSKKLALQLANEDEPFFLMVSRHSPCIDLVPECGGWAVLARDYRVSFEHLAMTNASVGTRMARSWKAPLHKQSPQNP